MGREVQGEEVGAEVVLEIAVQVLVVLQRASQRIGPLHLRRWGLANGHHVAFDILAQQVFPRVTTDARDVEHHLVKHGCVAKTKHGGCATCFAEGAGRSLGADAGAEDG